MATAQEIYDKEHGTTDQKVFDKGDLDYTKEILKRIKDFRKSQKNARKEAGAKGDKLDDQVYEIRIERYHRAINSLARKQGRTGVPPQGSNKPNDDLPADKLLAGMEKALKENDLVEYSYYTLGKLERERSNPGVGSSAQPRPGKAGSKLPNESPRPNPGSNKKRKGLNQK